MRRFLSAMALTSLTYGGLLTPAHSEVSFSLSIGDDDGYYMGLSNYYGVPQDRVSMLVDRGLSYDEVTVALYIADLANADPFEVADLRMSGMSWIEVNHYYGLGADVYYVSDEEPIGPYVSYYEPFRTHERSAWASLSLSDVAIINLANLRYTSQLYGVPAREVMVYRSHGDNFLRVNRNLFHKQGRIPNRPLARRAIRPQALPQQLRAEARMRRNANPVRVNNQQLERTRKVDDRRRGQQTQIERQMNNPQRSRKAQQPVSRPQRAPKANEQRRIQREQAQNPQPERNRKVNQPRQMQREQARQARNERTEARQARPQRQAPRAKASEPRTQSRQNAQGKAAGQAQRKAAGKQGQQRQGQRGNKH